MNPLNPAVNFDPSCTLLVETSPDPEKAASTALTCAVSDGYAPTISWLVTKEDGEQAIVVLMVRASRVGTPEPKRWNPVVGFAFVGAATALSIGGWCALLAFMLR